MQQHSKALSTYQKALELDPSNAEALDGYRACSTQLNSNPEEVRLLQIITHPIHVSLLQASHSASDFIHVTETNLILR